MLHLPPSQRSARESAGDRLLGVRVLVVDDDADARELAATLLSLHGAAVVTAASSAEARTLLRTRPFEVLVSDIWMPGEDGYALIRCVREEERKRGRTRTPALALTALALTTDRERAIEAGFDRYMAKPVEAGLLVKLIAALVLKA